MKSFKRTLSDKGKLTVDCQLKEFMKSPTMDIFKTRKALPAHIIRETRNHLGSENSSTSIL